MWVGRAHDFAAGARFGEEQGAKGRVARGKVAGLREGVTGADGGLTSASNMFPPPPSLPVGM